MEYIAITNGPQLTHYGVKGMKWGTRRRMRQQRKAEKRKLSTKDQQAKKKARRKKAAIAAGITAGVLGTAALSVVGAHYVNKGKNHVNSILSQHAKTTFDVTGKMQRDLGDNFKKYKNTIDKSRNAQRSKSKVLRSLSDDTFDRLSRKAYAGKLRIGDIPISMLKDYIKGR